MFADLSHYFDWCSLIEKRWRARVNVNPKTTQVNKKLREWHAKNPDTSGVNLAQWRINRARKQVGAM